MFEIGCLDRLSSPTRITGGTRSPGRLIVGLLAGLPMTGSAQTPQVGSCALGQAAIDFRAGQTIARLRNQQSFADNQIPFLRIPADDPRDAMWAHALWFGGRVDGDIWTAVDHTARTATSSRGRWTWTAIRRSAARHSIASSRYPRTTSGDTSRSGSPRPTSPSGHSASGPRSWMATGSLTTTISRPVTVLAFWAIEPHSGL